MDKTQLEQIIMDTAREEGGKTKLSCPQAFKLAADHDVELSDISKICNAKNIRLCECQLGCF